MFDGRTNCGSRTWSGGTIGGAVFGPAGPLAARTTCGVTVHKVAGSKRYRKLVTRLIVGGNALEFEVDTGAELSTIPAALYHKTLAHIPMHHSSVVLRLYDGSVLLTKGVITVQVKQGSQTVTGSFVIVENVDNQLPLLGRDWLHRISSTIRLAQVISFWQV